MKFYDNSKVERERISNEIAEFVREDYEKGCLKNIIRFSCDNDTYIRKIVYISIGRLYRNNAPLREAIINSLNVLISSQNKNIRQTAAYALGEIGKVDADKILDLLEIALFDKHHSVRNAVVGALKQMGEKNPKPTLEFAGKFIKHEDPEARRQVIHGIELRGREYPEDVLPLLETAQYDSNKKAREMLIHVLGQISYKKGCLEKVVNSIKKWENKDIVGRVVNEILDVHIRYEKFSAKSYQEAKDYIEMHFT